MSDRIAEVIESNTRVFLAEVYREASPPVFGRWVQVRLQDGPVLYGLVSHVEQASYDPHRRAVAFGKTSEELRQEMPHVMELLRTTFRAQVIAYRDARDRIRQTLPPHPAGIHDFVYPCTQEDVRSLGQPYDYLRTLVRSPDPSVPVDDLIVAVMAGVYEAHGGRHGGTDELVSAGRALSRLLNDDHERLQSILRRVL